MLWCVTWCALWLAASTAASAHRVDEYLQAARIAVAADLAEVEIDLTPGVAIAPAVFSWVDSNGDGVWSNVERDAYAALVVSSVVLEIDGRRATLAVTTSRFPSGLEMNEGVGTIRLTARARFPAVASGRHQLYFRNTHRRDASVYLVNALVPAADIEITGQRRDPLQHELRIDYNVRAANDAGWPRASRIAVGLGLVTVIAGIRGRARRARTVTTR